MIDKKLIPIGGLKKEPFSGCHGGMRYYFKMDESKETFTVTIYPEPWSFENTPDCNKESSVFPMSDEGMDSAIEWLHKMYEENKPKWQDSAKSKMHLVYKKH
ncbi:hypothetical protein [Muricomes intestini]|jgi:hypothetical protein|uniref:GNAT family acetyltransferase n=1 Tax=Muricomes intestini TaxID=1796634 RepID=A0A4V2US63_9FIRM|nr:hypothetical protein [Muricomes intestini]TCS80232.1 hypothetical protein EDD59_10657 [Muricomes intestini]HAX50923.1 hypothetical protein [Lachnospiraceae bacterium]HCR84487.1 hypothetical protein [Lachnospiraceae bacterium]